MWVIIPQPHLGEAELDIREDEAVDMDFEIVTIDPWALQANCRNVSSVTYLDQQNMVEVGLGLTSHGLTRLCACVLPPLDICWPCCYKIVLTGSMAGIQPSHSVTTRTV